MIKSILIPLDPSPYTDVAIDLGLRIAEVNDAQITGLVILDIPGIEKSIGSIPPGGVYYAERLEEKRRNDAEERVQVLLENFKKKCDAAGVRHEEARNQGSPSERIVLESMYYDLVITGLRTHFNFEVSDNPGESLEKLLDQSITPIYAVSETFKIPDPEKRHIHVVAPFDASFPSARALQRIGQLMQPEITDIRLVMSSDDEAFATAALENAQAYLAQHGFKNVETELTIQKIKDKLVEDYMDWADVFVVGAHSKKGFMDFMVGNLTKFLIDQNKKAVVIGQ